MMCNRNADYPYIFPYINRQLLRNKPFLSSGITEVLKTVSGLNVGPSSPVHLLADFFQPKPDEPPRIPITTLALAATSVSCAIY